MSFFKRNDPSAPAARRAGGTASPSPYERLPADNYSSQPQPPPAMPARRPAPPSDDYSSAGYGGRPQPPLPPRGDGGYGGSQGYPNEKAEYRPAQSGGQRGYGAPQGVSTGTGRGVYVFTILSRRCRSMETYPTLQIQHRAMSFRPISTDQSTGCQSRRLPSRRGVRHGPESLCDVNRVSRIRITPFSSLANIVQ